MAQKTWVWILIGIAAVFVIGMLVQKNYPIFAVLPAGQYRASIGCTFITNIAESSNYREADGYIAIDSNSDSNLDVYVYNGYSSYDCSTGITLGTTLEGYTICTRSGYDPLDRIYVRVGINGLIFQGSLSGDPDYTRLLPTAQTDINSCKSGGTCIESWTCGTWSTCSGNLQTRTCTDSNNCGTTINRPAESQNCGTGTCLIQDSDSDGKVGRSELGIAIQRWVSGT